VRPTLYLVAPASLESWFAGFVPPGPADDVVLTGEGPDLDVRAILERLGDPGARVAVFLSAHETLVRDCGAARDLRELGHEVVAQSPACAVLGTDKFAMKAFFDGHGFTSPPWARADAVARLGPPDLPLVVKQRHGTQSVGTRLERLAACRLAAGEYAEAYHDGVEYSVVAYRDALGCAVFPPVWKGCTSPALVPPWRRLRLCPFPGLAAATDAALRRTTRALAEAADCAGFLEVEYLVTAAGPQVLEVNPRVSGTMRISAMATAVPIFGMHRLTALRGDLAATHHAAEVPFAGKPFRDPANGVVATSRLTVAATGAGELLDRLRRLDAAAAREVAALRTGAAPRPPDDRLVPAPGR
jgi:carbamoylphosphate synthase large subunit